MHTPFLFEIRRELKCLVFGKLLIELAKPIWFGRLFEIDGMGIIHVVPFSVKLAYRPSAQAEKSRE